MFCMRHKNDNNACEWWIIVDVRSLPFNSYVNTMYFRGYGCRFLLYGTISFGFLELKLFKVDRFDENPIKVDSGL